MQLASLTLLHPQCSTYVSNTLFSNKNQRVHKVQKSLTKQLQKRKGKGQLSNTPFWNNVNLVQLYCMIEFPNEIKPYCSFSAMDYLCTYFSIWCMIHLRWIYCYNEHTHRDKSGYCAWKDVGQFVFWKHSLLELSLFLMQCRLHHQPKQNQ